MPLFGSSGTTTYDNTIKAELNQKQVEKQIQEKVNEINCRYYQDDLNKQLEEERKLMDQAIFRAAHQS